MFSGQAATSYRLDPFENSDHVNKGDTRPEPYSGVQIARMLEETDPPTPTPSFVVRCRSSCSLQTCDHALITTHLCKWCGCCCWFRVCWVVVRRRYVSCVYVCVCVPMLPLVVIFHTSLMFFHTAARGLKAATQARECQEESHGFLDDAFSDRRTKNTRRRASMVSTSKLVLKRNDSRNVKSAIVVLYT